MPAYGLMVRQQQMEYFLEMDEKGWCLKAKPESDYFKMFEPHHPQVLGGWISTFAMTSPSSGGGFCA